MIVGWKFLLFGGLNRQKEVEMRVAKKYVKNCDFM